MSHQPHRVIAELPNGVWLEPVCALCRESGDMTTCVICDRMFCASLCYGVHLNARDEHDAPDRVDAFLRSPEAYELLDLAFEGASYKTRDGRPFDWRHGLSCDDCRADLREIVMQMLCDCAIVLRSEDTER